MKGVTFAVRAQVSQGLVPQRNACKGSAKGRAGEDTGYTLRKPGNWLC